MPRRLAAENAACRTRSIASAVTALLLTMAACLGPVIHGDEPPAASGQAATGPGGYRLFVGIVGNPSVPDISWSDEELTQIKQLGVNMVQLSIAWGGKPAGEVLNLEDLDAEQREKFKFRIAQAQKHGRASSRSREVDGGEATTETEACCLINVQQRPAAGE